MTMEHYGRSWSGHHIEDACPCSQELCGLVSDETRHSDCEQHTMSRTIRQIHPAATCPGAPMDQETIQYAGSDYLKLLIQMVADGQKRNDPTLAIALGVDMLRMLIDEVIDARAAKEAGQA